MSTENTDTTAETAQDVTDDQAQAHDTTDAPGGNEQDDSGPGREAAKYRRKLREAEAERDALREAVASIRRAEVERIAGATVQNPAGLWAAGVDVGDLLDDAGQVDPAKVQAATLQAAETLGLARPRPGNYVAREGGNPRVRPQADMAAVVRGSDAF